MEGASIIRRAGLGGRIVRNSTYLFVANSAAKIFAFFLNALIIWSISDEAFGAYRYVVAYVGVLANLIEFGMLRVGVRAIARAPSQAPAVFRGLFRTKAILSIVSAGLLVLITECFLRGVEDFELVRVLSYIWLLVVVVHVMRKNHEAVFLGLEKMGWTAFFLVVNRFITLALAFLFLRHDNSLVGLFILFLTIDLVDLGMQALAMLRILKKDLPAIEAAHQAGDNLIREEGREVAESEDFSKRGFFAWLRESAPFALQELTGEIYMRIDTFMLGTIIGMTASADYNKAYLIMTALLVLPNSICQAVFPQLAAMFRRNPDEMRLFFRRNYLLMVAIGPFIMAAFHCFAPLILWVMKGDYLDVIRVYNIAITTLPVYFLTMPLSYFLGAVFQQRWVTIVSVSMAAFNIVVNLILIPKFGPLGAAAATFMTELLALVLFAGYLQKHFPGLFDVSGLLRLAGGHGIALIIGSFIWEYGWAARLCYLAIYGSITAVVLFRLRIKSRVHLEEPAE